MFKGERMRDERGSKRGKQKGLLGVKFPLDMICGYGDVMKSMKWK